MRYEGEIKYKQFMERLVTTEYEIIGIRVPILRAMVKQMIKDGSWKEELLTAPQYHEDVLIHSFIIAEAPMKVEERLQRLESFFSYMDNWQVVDGLCSSLKEAKKHQQQYWHWLLSLRQSEEPYVIRFVIVMYLTYFLQDDYLQEVLAYFEKVDHDHYYVKMAVAWAISIAFVKHEQQVTRFLHVTMLDTWTFNKALQKIIESKKISNEQKHMVREWKRK